MWVEPLGPCCKDIFKEQIETETTWSTKVSNEIAVEHLLFVSWAYHSQAMQGGEQAFLQRMSALAEAASAAEKVLNLMATSGSGGSSGSAGDVAQAGLSMASRVLKNPDCFTGDAPTYMPPNPQSSSTTCGSRS